MAEEWGIPQGAKKGEEWGIPQGGETPKPVPLSTAPPSMNYPNRFLVGLGGGMYGAGLGAVQTGAEIGNRLGVVSPQTVNALRQQELERRQAMETLKQEHRGAPWWSPNPASVGEFVGEVAPFMAIPVAGTEKTAASLIGRVAPKIAPSMGRIAAGVGIGGATAGLAPRTEEESRTKNVALGAALGGAVAGSVEGGKAAWRHLSNTGEVDKVIDYGLARAGIKPTAAKSQAQLEDFRKAGRSAVKDIFETTKEPLFDGGERRLPQSVDELSYLVQKTKADLYNQFHGKMVEAAKTGGDAAVVDVRSVVRELERIAEDKAFQTHGDKSAFFHVQELIGKYQAHGKLTLPEAEQFIATLNQKTSAFYKNPSADTVSLNYVNESVAAKLRDGLDRAITGLDGPGYRELKRRYGALKTIEEKTARAAARASGMPSALEKLATDRYSNVRMAYGLMTGNLPSAASAGAVKGLAIWQKWKFNPNRVVKDMFSYIDAAANKVPLSANKIAAKELAKRAAVVIPAAIAAKGKPPLSEFDQEFSTP